MEFTKYWECVNLLGGDLQSQGKVMGMWETEWTNKTTMNSGVGRNSMKRKKKNDNILNGSDANNLCNYITPILKCPIQIVYWMQWNTTKQQKGVNHKSISQHGYQKHNVEKSKLKNTCHLIPFISSVMFLKTHKTQ